MSISTPTNVDYLIPELRLQLGDIDPSSYRYVDEWLRAALLYGISALGRWWEYRYIVNETTYQVSRNPAFSYAIEEPPVIDARDKRPVILMASILIKSGMLEKNSWFFGSWKDAEYSVTNIASKDAKEKSLQADWDELLLFLKPPQKRLTTGSRITFDFGSDETK
jgi:hypothetical protein